MEKHCREKECLSVCMKPGIFERKVCEEKIVGCLDLRQNKSQYLMTSACNM